MDTGLIARSGVVPLNQAERQADKQLKEVAEGFERLFARHLVEQITKDSFRSDDNSMGVGGSSRMVRHQIIDTLTHTLTEERALGMADMVEHFWDGSQVAPSLNEPNASGENDE